MPNKIDTSSERSFEVLELKYPEEKDSDDIADLSYSPIMSKNTEDKPYSTNISTNSVFHADYKLPTIKPSLSFEKVIGLTVPEKHLTLDLPLSSSPLDDDLNIDKVRKETERRLSRYMKNYSDLARTSRSQSESHSRSTQTTPETSGRRDIVLQDANNLSMPLLREMPKMTRKECNKLAEESTYKHKINHGPTKIDNLKRRWEVLFKYAPILLKISTIFVYYRFPLCRNLLYLLPHREF